VVDAGRTEGSEEVLGKGAAVVERNTQNTMEERPCLTSVS
jgi:hypothetical protein